MINKDSRIGKVLLIAFLACACTPIEEHNNIEPRNTEAENLHKPRGISQSDSTPLFLDFYRGLAKTEFEAVQDRLVSSKYMRQDDGNLLYDFTITTVRENGKDTSFSTYATEVIPVFEEPGLQAVRLRFIPNAICQFERYNDQREACLSIPFEDLLKLYREKYKEVGKPLSDLFDRTVYNFTNDDSVHVRIWVQRREGYAPQRLTELNEIYEPTEVKFITGLEITYQPMSDFLQDQAQQRQERELRQKNKAAEAKKTREQI